LPLASAKIHRESAILGKLVFPTRGFLQNRRRIAEYVRFCTVHFVRILFVFIHIAASNGKKRILFFGLSLECGFLFV